MSNYNYEAIGRCQVMLTTISSILERRLNVVECFNLFQRKAMRPLNPMKHSMEMHAVDTEGMTAIVSDVAKVNDELMTAVDEYNHWCSEAGVKPIVINTSDAF